MFSGAPTATPTPSPRVAPFIAPNPVSRFAWIAGSRKAQIAFGSLITTLLAQILPLLHVSPAAVGNITTAILTIGAAWIAGIAIEDNGTNSAKKTDPAAPESSAEGNEPPSTSPGRTAP